MSTKKSILLTLMLVLSAACWAATEINGICYNLNSSRKTAEVIYRSKKYSGSVVIPEKFIYGNVTYQVTDICTSAFGECSGLTSITIPTSVTRIGKSAFYGCSGLTSITIPSSVTSIEDNTFYDCSGLTSVTIPTSVTSIGNLAFMYCRGLTSVTIPTSVTSIGRNAFFGCNGLISITIPSSVASIGSGAFENCSGLTSITISTGVTSIGQEAFVGCTNLTSITIPSSVTSIVGNAFTHCSGLTSIQVDAGNKVYDSRDNCNAIIETASNTLVSGCKSTIISSNVTSIGDYAFLGCSGPTSITIPSSVTSIGGGAFRDCSGLTSITIPLSVTSIFSYTFYGCSGLTSVTIPSSVTSIRNAAFAGCSSLTDCYCYAKEIPSTGGSAFSNSNYKKATLHVPAASLNAYRTTAPWSEFGTIVPIEGVEEDGDDLQRYLDSLVDTEDEWTNGIYRREFHNDDWQALYVPFEVNYSSWADNFEVARIDGDLNSRSDHTWLGATIVESGNLEANYPYLIRAKSKAGAMLTVNVNSSSEKTSWVSFGPYSFKGNYSKLTGLKKARYYRLQGGSLSIPYNDSEVLLPYRWYMRIAGNQAARELRLCINGEVTTGMNPITNHKSQISNSQVYDLRGRRIDTDSKSLPKGIYIINNKKCVVK